MPMVLWSAIDTVLLDMDGTLLDLRFDNYFWLEYLPRRYAEQHGTSMETASTRLKTFSDSLHGSLQWYCLDHWSQELGMDVEAVKLEIRDRVAFRPGAEEFLRFLHGSGKHCVLVTNAHPKALALKCTATGLGKYMHAMYSTHPFGLAKENAGFWPALAYATGLDYHRCLFIDDSLHVLRRASDEGLAQLVQVLQPDMSQAPRERSEFPGIVHFAELMPA